MQPLNCPICDLPQLPTYKFCPSCGTNQKEILGIEKQIGLYLLSFFLPPLGLFPGIKYFMSKNSHLKHMGLAAILITLASCIITIWGFFAVINQVNSTINQQINLQNYGL